jgi:hypothetical protein
VLVLLRIARVDDVHEQIGVRSLLERRAERREQILRKIANEADRVGDDDLAIADAPVSVLSSVLLPAFV